MNKNIKKVITISMLTSILVSNNVKAEDLGTPVLGVRTNNLTNYLVTCKSEDDFWDNILDSNIVSNTSPKISNDNEADKSVISYFKDAKSSINRYLNSEDYTNLKSKAKNLIITGIDFLFYDGTINGYTRKQITEKGKEEIMNTIAETIELLEEYYPGLTDTILDKYGKAKDYLKEKFNNILSYIENWIGEDYYNSFSNEFSDFKEELGDLGNLFGSFLDDKYQSWKLK